MRLGGGWAFCLGLVLLCSASAACGASRDQASGGAGGTLDGDDGGVAAQGGNAGSMGGSAGSMLGGAGGAGAGGTGGGGGSGGSEGACANVDLQTDPEHCGACRHHCRGAACTDGMCEPTPLLDRYNTIEELTLDETSIYFRETEAVSSVVKSGGSDTLLFELPPSVRDLQVHDGQLYFAREADDEDHTEGVYRIPVSGGAEAVVFEGLDEAMSGLAVRAERIFFMGDCASVWSVPRAGGTPEPVATSACNAFSGPLVVSPSGAHGYYRDSDLSALIAIDLATAELSIVKDNFYSRHVIASDEAVYVAIEAACEGAIGERVCHGGWIEAIDRADGNAERLLDLASIERPEGYESIGGMALDGKDLFFELIEVGHRERRLFALPLTGGPPRTLAVLKGGSAGIAVDEAFVYVAHDGQRLHRLPK